MFRVIQQMLNLDRRVITKCWEFAVHLLHNRQRVRWTIKEVRIAETDVLRANCNLAANIFQHNFALHDAECSVINGNNRTMSAEMFASAARFGVSDNAISAIGMIRCAYFASAGSPARLRNAEFLFAQRNFRILVRRLLPRVDSTVFRLSVGKCAGQSLDQVN